MSHDRYVFSLFAVIVFLLTSQICQAQDSQRFQKEVDSIVSHNLSVDKTDLILFTGSSSIRMWKDLKTAFPNHNVVNLGFGGSEMADLLYHIDKLVLQFKPKQIFIYEGDNDIAVGRSPENIFAAADATVARIHKELPDTEIIFISPKPSVARWHLKDKYEAFNTSLRAWTKDKRNVKYADVWTPMLKKNGVVRDDIFLGDKLHMNKKGYAIWTKELEKHLN